MGAMVDVGDLDDGEVAEAESRDAGGVEWVVGLHRVLQHGDADGGVHRRGAEAAAEAEAEGLRADAAHGTALAGLPPRRVALARRRHGWAEGDWGRPPGGEEMYRRFVVGFARVLEHERYWGMFWVGLFCYE